MAARRRLESPGNGIYGPNGGLQPHEVAFSEPEEPTLGLAALRVVGLRARIPAPDETGTQRAQPRPVFCIGVGTLAARTPALAGERHISELCPLPFLHEAENVVFLGPPGVGKTHLAVALAVETIRGGVAAYFITGHELVADLGRAYREDRLAKRMRIYPAPKLLIIDEMDYLPLDELGATILYHLISARYELEQHHPDLELEQELRRLGLDLRRSIIAAAILDRLLDHSTTTTIRGESHRLKGHQKGGLLARPETTGANSQAGPRADPPGARRRRGRSRR